jgi:hypothetical protein
MSDDNDDAHDRREWQKRERAQTFTFGELMEAVANLAALRVEHEFVRVASAHDTQKHYGLNEGRDCGVVQNILMGPPTEMGHYPALTDRLTAGCALAHLLEALWDAEADLIKVERPAAESSRGRSRRRRGQP